MIRANHSKFWVKFSKYYTKTLIGFFFGRVKFIGQYEEKGLPILMISNHFSFYDGFIQILLNFKIFKRRFNFMMLEKELSKNMILTKIGASSITKGKGKLSNMASLDYAVEMLQDKENLFLFFPQGKIKSIYTREFTFEKGLLSYILENTKNDFQLMYNVNLINYGTNLRPDIYAYYQTQTISTNTNAEDVEREFNRFAKSCFTKQGV